MWFSFGREESCCLGRQFWEVFFLGHFGKCPLNSKLSQKRGDGSHSIVPLVVTCSERGARRVEREGELPVFWGDEKSLATPLAKHEISMRVFKAGDVLRRQMLYRLGLSEISKIV